MQSLNDFEPAYFNISEVADVIIVRFLVPRLSEDQNIEQLGHDLFALVEQYERKKVVLSLACVEYLTSSVLGKLITMHRKMHRSQGRLVICELQPEVREVLRLSRLIDYFKTVETVEHALTEMQAA